MNKIVNVKVLKIINPKIIERMIEEVESQSQVQKISEELYFLREQNAVLENQIILLKDERKRLKSSVESAISTIVIAYEKVNVEDKSRIDKFRKQAAEILKVSDLLGIFIGE